MGRAAGSDESDLAARSTRRNPVMYSPKDEARRSATPQPTARGRPGHRLTVCHPVWQLGYGGLERQMLQVLPRMPTANFSHVLVVRGDSREARQPVPDGLVVVPHAGPARNRQWARRLAKELQAQNADLVHVRGLGMLLDGVTAAGLADRPVVFSFHGIESLDVRPTWLRRRMLRGALQRCTMRFAVSHAARQRLADLLEFPTEAIEVLPNGVDTEQFRPVRDRAAVRAALELPQDRLIVLSVGNLKRIKGHHVLREAIRGSGIDPRRVTFVLVGADDGGESRTWAAGNLAAYDIRFAGLRTEVERWYQAADVFVLPSLWEGLSNALLEAMASGLAIIATAVGGTPEVITDEQNGLLVPSQDAPAMASLLRRLTQDAGLRERLGTAARRSVEQRFAIERAAAAWAGVYRTAAAGRPPLRRTGQQVAARTAHGPHARRWMALAAGGRRRVEE